VAVASKLAGSAAPHKPIAFEVPETYKPKRGPNKWANESRVAAVEALIRAFDSDRDFIITAEELYALLSKADPSITREQAMKTYDELLAGAYDANGDGQLSVEEVAVYWVELKKLDAIDIKDIGAKSGLVSPPKAPPKDVPAKPADVTIALAPPAPAPAAAIEPVKELSLSDRIKGMLTPATAPQPVMAHVDAMEEDKEHSLKA
jgi:hypothetical protein